MTVPAKEVGGDFYDFFLIDETTLGFVIGDVSGKSVPAALYMAVSRSLLKATALRGFSPGECLTKVNGLLLPDGYSAMFVTLFYATLDLRSGHVKYANGGHNPPYLKRSDRKIERIEGEHGMAVGLNRDEVYDTFTLTLNEGDSLFLYTDGITEAENDAMELFDDSRLEVCLEEMDIQPVEGIVDRVKDRVNEFCAGAVQADDITMMALQFFGKTNPNSEGPNE